MTTSTNQDAPYTRSKWAVAAGETFLIFLLFFIYAGGPTPDNDEAHYLAKAKHYWDSSYCPGDHFLGSADAHQVFVWTFGWLTLFLPLSAVAWIGRVIAWGLLALSWRRLSFAIAPKPLFALVSAGLFLLLSQRCQLAREWVVGGFEAKCLAYAFVWLGLEAVVLNRWRQAWLLLGVGSSFHVLVGGWSVVACGFAWLLAGKTRPSLVSQIPALAGGLLLALPGLVPAAMLTWGVDKQVVAEANQIYVFERLSHHLVPHLFEGRRVAIFGVLLIAWIGLANLVRREASQRRLQSFVLGALFIAAMGALLDVVLRTRPDLAAAILRYYWFRLADVALPLGVALALLGCIAKLEVARPVAAQWVISAAILAGAINLGAGLYVKRLDPRSGADIQSLPKSGPLPEQTQEQILADWQRACAWISSNTPADAVFLTPRRQQTFKWYAGRSEVYCWKDVPQDARALVEWRERREKIFPEEGAVEHPRERDLLRHGDGQLAGLCREFGARYFVVDKTMSQRRPRFLRVYPKSWDDTPSTYEVYDATLPIRP